VSADTADDVALTRAFDALAANAPGVARMQVRVLEGYERRSRSLAREWLGLLRARPLANSAWLAAAAAILLVSTPLGAVTRLLLEQRKSSALAAATLDPVGPLLIPHRISMLNSERSPPTMLIAASHGQWPPQDPPME
jgi:hypothetical protein